MLFVLPLEPLQWIMVIATEQGLLSPVMQSAAKMRASLYADYAALFVNPIKEELHLISGILGFFCHVFGLNINFNKCVIFPISYGNLILPDILSGFGGRVGILLADTLAFP